MNYLVVVPSIVIAVVIVVAWFYWYKHMKGDGTPTGRESARAPAESLEDFVAAYRRGEVSVKFSPAPSAVLPASASAGSASAPASAAALNVAGNPIAKAETFLTGATKVVYLACKSGMRDHHCFAQVRLQSLCTGRLDDSLQSAVVDIVVCNASMAIIAAIDIAVADPAPAEAAKAACLRSLGIRYLRLSPKALPKPEEVRTLLYRM